MVRDKLKGEQLRVRGDFFSKKYFNFDLFNNFCGGGNSFGSLFGCGSTLHDGENLWQYNRLYF
jgi:hypothetical protein